MRFRYILYFLILSWGCIGCGRNNSTIKSSSKLAVKKESINAIDNSPTKDTKQCNNVFKMIKVENIGQDKALGIYSVSNFKASNPDCWFALREYSFNIILDPKISNAYLYFVDTLFADTDTSLKILMEKNAIQKRTIALYKYCKDSSPEFISDPFKMQLYFEPKSQ